MTGSCVASGPVCVALQSKVCLALRREIGALRAAALAAAKACWSGMPLSSSCCREAMPPGMCCISPLCFLALPAFFCLLSGGVTTPQPPPPPYLLPFPSPSFPCPFPFPSFPLLWRIRLGREKTLLHAVLAVAVATFLEGRPKVRRLGLVAGSCKPGRLTASIIISRHAKSRNLRSPACTGCLCWPTRARSIRPKVGRQPEVAKEGPRRRARRAGRQPQKYQQRRKVHPSPPPPPPVSPPSLLAFAFLLLLRQLLPGCFLCLFGEDRKCCCSGGLSALHVFSVQDGETCTGACSLYYPSLEAQKASNVALCPSCCRGLLASKQNCLKSELYCQKSCRCCLFHSKVHSHKASKHVCVLVISPTDLTSFPPPSSARPCPL